MRSFRSRRDVARSLRAELGEPAVDEPFVERLAAVAASVPPVSPPRSRHRVRLAVATSALTVLTVGGGIGVAYGAGLVSAPWSPDPKPPAVAPTSSATPDQTSDPAPESTSDPVDPQPTSAAPTPAAPPKPTRPTKQPGNGNQGNQGNGNHGNHGNGNNGNG